MPLIEDEVILIRQILQQGFDLNRDSLLHTLGLNPPQASPGNHIHDGKTSKRMPLLISKTAVPTSVGFSTIGAGWEDFKYCADTSSRIHLSGVMRPTSGLAVGGNVIANLPAGFRPFNRQVFRVSCSNTGAANDNCRVDVNNNGDIIAQLDIAISNTGWLSLNGINWQAEQ